MYRRATMQDMLVHQFGEGSCRATELVDELVCKAFGILVGRVTYQHIAGSQYRTYMLPDYQRPKRHLIVSMLPDFGDDFEKIFVNTSKHILGKHTRSCAGPLKGVTEDLLQLLHQNTALTLFEQALRKLAIILSDSTRLNMTTWTNKT